MSQSNTEFERVTYICRRGTIHADKEKALWTLHTMFAARCLWRATSVIESDMICKQIRRSAAQNRQIDGMIRLWRSSRALLFITFGIYCFIYPSSLLLLMFDAVPAGT